MPRNQPRRLSRAAFIGCLLLTGLVLAACGRAGPKIQTIGVINYDPILAPVLDGFKAKMVALGYVEGQNVT